MKLTVATAALLAEAATITSSSSSILHGKGSLPFIKYTSATSSIGAAPRQLEALQAIPFKTQNAQQDYVWKSAKNFLKNKKQPSSSFSTRGSKLRDWMAFGLQRHLVELVEQERDMFEECDPIIIEDADVGVLSCGQGRYCLESGLLAETVPFESSTGGICIDMPSSSTVKMLNDMAERRQAQEDTGRSLQLSQDGDEYGIGNTSILQDMYDICYGNVLSPNAVACQCTGIDMVAYRGSLSCQYQQQCDDLENVCVVDVTFCSTMSYQLDVVAPYTGSFRFQHEFTLPYTFRYQYGVNYAGSPQPESCTISFDDTQCNSCQFKQVVYNGSTEPIDCISFDCSNTKLGLSDTLCVNTIVDSAIHDYLMHAPLPCDNGCNLCGTGGYITNTEENVTLPSGDTLNCRWLEFVALAGYLEGSEPDLCIMLPPIVNVTCGCVSVENVTDFPSGPPAGAGVTFSPTLVKFSEPTAAPITVPAPSSTSAATNINTKMTRMVGTMVAVIIGWVLVI